MRIVIVQVFAIVAFSSLALALDSKAQELLDKKVTLEIENKSMAHVLNRLEKATEVKFIYSPEVIQGERKVSLRARNEALTTILENLLAPLNLTYEVIGKQIVVRKTPATGSLSTETLQVAALTITGKVVSDQGEALPGVSILLKGTNSGTATDVNGAYSLVAPDGNGTLVFSFIGYTSEEVPINDRTVIDVTLMPDIKSLQEVVVTALGIKREQKALGYAVSTVSAEQITQAANTNFASALYGKVAGVKITTAPGGAGSAVNVQIRGINSLNYNQQPLYVVDGIMIRNDAQNGVTGANNANNYWGDQRIRGNGILDINPADIESLSVLKGASASALYGSDAASGVVVITTKKGSKSRGLGVDLNYNFTVERAAFLPKFQSIYGPGYDRATNLANGANAEGWIPEPNSPTGFRPYFRAYAQFGPKMEGQQVMWWDGSIRPFTAQPNNYADIFDKGFNSNLNIALSNQTDKINYRLSATNMDYKGISPGNTQKRNTFSLNSTVKLNDKLTTDLVVSYVNTRTHNRAAYLGQVVNSFDGFVSRAEDINLMRQRFQTSNGYKYSTLAQNRPEHFIYNMRGTTLLDYYWNQLKNSYDETENRLISSATLNWNVADHFKVRGRIGNDFTGRSIEDKQHNEYALAYNEPTRSTGAYVASSGQYSVLYGDVLATYSNQLGSDFDFSLSGGFQSRSESYKDQMTSTQGGLVTENWFSISNSYAINGSSLSFSRRQLLKYAYLGMLNMGYKNFLFLEATARQEYASSLPPANNQYFYPSVNASFVFTDAFQLPAFLSFGKVRASYGIVGNAPPAYESNIAYYQTSLQTTGNGSVPQLYLGGVYGNNSLMPEKKYEQEVGLDVRVLNNRLGFDISYYSNSIKNQILPLATAPTNGATGQIVNVGEVGSKGVEIALNANPIAGALRWDTRINFAFNRSRLISLAGNVEQLTFYDTEQSAIKLVAKPGEQLGNIYVHPRATDANGNFLINDNGLYVIDRSRYVNAGNIMPKMVGGFSNTLSYSNFSLDVTIDYRLGGQMVSPATKYQTGAGLYENTLQYRDAANGGLAYTENGVTYNDGVLLQGINQNTGEPNTRIISAPYYYMNTFAWGGNAWNEKAIFDNSFVKLREAVLSYRIPADISNKLHLNNLRVSLVGRNLFYIWRTLENLDPEAPLGNQWWSQGVDVGSTAATRSFGFSLNASF